MNWTSQAGVGGQADGVVRNAEDEGAHGGEPAGEDPIVSASGLEAVEADEVAFLRRSIREEEEAPGEGTQINSRHI